MTASSNSAAKGGMSARAGRGAGTGRRRQPVRLFRVVHDDWVAREHKNFVNIWGLRKRMEGSRVDSGRLGFQTSGWQGKWVFASCQMRDLCEEMGVSREEVEWHLKHDRQRQFWKRDSDEVAEAMQAIVQLIKKETESAQRIILMRAENIPFGKIYKLNPGRFYPSMVDDYVNFLRKAVATYEWEFLTRQM